MEMLALWYVHHVSVIFSCLFVVAKYLDLLSVVNDQVQEARRVLALDVIQKNNAVKWYYDFNQ